MFSLQAVYVFALFTVSVQQEPDPKAKRYEKPSVHRQAVSALRKRQWPSGLKWDKTGTDMNFFPITLLCLLLLQCVLPAPLWGCKSQRDWISIFFLDNDLMFSHIPKSTALLFQFALFQRPASDSRQRYELLAKANGSQLLMDPNFITEHYHTSIDAIRLLVSQLTHRCRKMNCGD